MKRKSLILAAALTTSVILAISGCGFGGLIGGNDSGNDQQEEAAPQEEPEEAPEVSEPESDPEPDSNTITLIPEDTNYDEPEIEDEDEYEPGEEIEPEDEESGLIVASDITPEDGEVPEGDDIMSREGNWAVATSGVNVRSAPSGGDIIGSIEQGAQVKVLAVEGNWYVINYEGQQAYVYSEYFE